MDNRDAFNKLPPQVMGLLAPLNVAAGVLNPDVVRNVRSQLRGRRASQGQFNKVEVCYMPFTLIPPSAYFYECSNCVFYRQSTKTCELVAGNIEPYAWCGLWINKEEDKPFSWLTRIWK